MRDDNVPILPKHMERDAEKLKLLERWKEPPAILFALDFHPHPHAAINFAAEPWGEVRPFRQIALTFLFRSACSSSRNSPPIGRTIRCGSNSNGRTFRA